MTKITNISAGPRGVNTEDGVIHLAPGEERDLKVSDAELKSLSEEWFRVGKASKAEVETARDEASADDDAPRVRRAQEAQAASEASAKK